MRRILGILAVVAPLYLLSAAPARAQVGFGFPGYQSYGAVSGYGMPYAYGGYGYGGYGSGYGSVPNYGLGLTSVYSSGYSSAYVAPGTTYFNSGYYAPSYGYGGYGYGYPSVGVRSYGYGLGGLSTGYGYGSGGLGRSGYVSTGPFMGLPRPFAGLIRVPR